MSAQAQLVARRADRSRLLDQWEIDRKPSLAAIRDAAMDLLSAIEAQREQTYIAKDVAEIDAQAADIASAAVAMLHHLHAGYLREADEAGVADDMMRLDLWQLELSASLWATRAAARRTT